MKYLILLSLILTACASDENSPRGDVYYSIEAIKGSGVWEPCMECLIIEARNNSIILRYGLNIIEECRGAGHRLYLSKNGTTFNPTLNSYIWEGDNAPNPNACFTEDIIIETTGISSDVYELSFNGKFYKVRKY